MTEQAVIYEAGQEHGSKRCIDPDGSVYEGSWQNGLKSGYGIITYTTKYRCSRKRRWGVPFGSDGSRNYEKHKFEGNFENGMKNGVGILYMENGYTIHGNWVDDMIYGEATIVDDKGSKTECVFYKNSKIQLSGTESESR